jgi:hypothetical protein
LESVCGEGPSEDDRDGDKLISFTFQSTDKLLAAASLEREVFLRGRTQLDAGPKLTQSRRTFRLHAQLN